jgi:hypothetical protein
MGGIHAGAVRAEMVEGQTVRDGADEQLIGDAVRVNLTADGVNGRAAVAVMGQVTSPQPAAIRPVDEPPETDLDGGRAP